MNTVMAINNAVPLVSVCVQTYQHAEYIRECLESILVQQTNFAFEIIIGEDESTDGTRDICQEYAEKHPGLIRLLFRSRKNVIYVKGYPTGRFNFVQNLKEARGKYIALLEGDDYWVDPLKLQKQVDILEKETEVIVCHHWQRYKIERKGHESEAPKAGHGYLPQTIATVEDIFANKLRVKTRSMMFRNIISDDFFPDWYMKVAFGDVPLNFLLGKHGKFFFLDEEMAVYRITGKGMSSAGSEKPKEVWVREHFFNWIEIWNYANRHYGGAFRESAEKTILYFYLHILNNSGLKSSMSIFFHALQLRSMGKRNTIILALKILSTLKHEYKLKINTKIARIINER